MHVEAQAGGQAAFAFYILGWYTRKTLSQDSVEGSKQGFKLARVLQAVQSQESIISAFPRLQSWPSRQDAVHSFIYAALAVQHQPSAEGSRTAINATEAMEEHVELLARLLALLAQSAQSLSHVCPQAWVHRSALSKNQEASRLHLILGSSNSTWTCRTPEREKCSRQSWGAPLYKTEAAAPSNFRKTASVLWQAAKTCVQLSKKETGCRDRNCSTRLIRKTFITVNVPSASLSRAFPQETGGRGLLLLKSTNSFTGLVQPSRDFRMCPIGTGRLKARTCCTYQPNSVWGSDVPQS